METQTQEKYLFQLTVKEYKSLLKETLEELVPELIRKEVELLKDVSQPDLKAEKDTMSVSEAAELTGLKFKSVYSKVSRLEMPVLTRGRPLMFSRKELNEWMRNGRPTVGEIMLEKYKERKENKLKV